MDEQVIQPSMPMQDHSHTGLYATVALSLSAAAILLVIVFAMLAKKPIPYQPQTTTLQYQPQDNQTTTQQPASIQTQVQQVTPMPIQTQQNLQAIAQTLDSTSMTQITAGLDQNSQDTSSFNQ